MSISIRPLLAICFVLSLCAAVHAREALKWDFESPDEDWVDSPLDKGTQKLCPSTDRATSGKSSLAVTGSLPAGFGATYYPWDDWTGFEKLTFDLYVPKGVPKEFDVWVYLKDKQYLWYQAAPFRSPTTGKVLTSFKPGQWLKVSLDVSPTSTAWKPGGHRKAWERSLYYPREF
ncbi:MAG: hypothetical protein ABFD94_04685, partial [Armatimonadia bacterium]